MVSLLIRAKVRRGVPSSLHNQRSSLNRFVQAQERDYDRALSEIRSGRKQSHWYFHAEWDGKTLHLLGDVLELDRQYKPR